MDAFYIILTISFFSIACSLLGTFLILRKMAMIGDAIAHAVLPGIVIAFLLSGNRNSLLMVISASLVGLLTTFLIQFLSSKIKLQSDAAIGITYTSLFAIGILLISLYAGKVDLDQDCVLYGEATYIPLDLWITETGINLGPHALYTSGFILLAVVCFIFLGYKELKISTFDPLFAITIGINTVLWNYLLMGMVSITTVTAFHSVGAILIVALMIIPAATAYLISTRLRKIFIHIIWITLFNSLLGYILSVIIDGSITGAIVTISFFTFICVLLRSVFIKKHHVL